MKVLKFFDKLEDRTRGFLSRHPLWYAFIAGIALVLFWRGVWHTTDAIADIVWNGAELHSAMDLSSPFWDGPISLAIGSVMLLACGVFVSELLGKEIIISGLRGETNLAKKTEVEVRTETGAIGEIRHEMRVILRKLHSMDKKMDAQSGPKDGKTG